ncbi:MAG: bifunctional UDP-N-acetylglucosamine diphosphorylase/glucosamine-1-phosphate N-acetyltransferase GlmU [Nitrospirota bacterium]
MNPTVVILAAGLGTRMKSGLAKALHPLAERPLIQHVLKAVSGIHPAKSIVVLGHQAHKVQEVLSDSGVTVVIQAEQLGTGHAVQQTTKSISAFSGPVLILCADTPLVRESTLQAVLDHHTKSKAAVTVLTTTVENPFGYGRIVRKGSRVQRIIEEKDATASQKKIREVNTGIYCFNRDFLLSSLVSLGKNNAQGEYYLPDTVALAEKKKKIVTALVCQDPDEVMGINSRYDLSRAEAIMRNRINKTLMLNGVTMLDPDTIFVGSDVSVGKDVVLYPGVRLQGKTMIGDGCTIYPGSRIADCVLKNNVTVKDYCVIEESEIASGASLGPFAHIRPKSVILENARIGNFVEIKKTRIGKGSKASHLSYIGDSIVGENVNIGAGVITCNYDGFEKHATIIEDNVFVGSDAQLVAPVKIGHDAVIAAGATITRDVPADALAISRVPQSNREEYASRRKQGKQKH